MKFFLVLVGAVCLAGSIHAQSTLGTTVTNAINTSKASVNTAIQQLNSTINAADQSVATAYTQFTQSLAALYQTYYTRFQNYTTIDLSTLSQTIQNLPTMMSPPQPIQDWSTNQIFTDVQSSVQQVETTLNAAVQTMTNSCAPPCANAAKVATCTTKWGPKLSTAPITIDRITDCVTAELVRFSDIGSNMASMYTNLLTSASNYLKVVDVCDTPAADVLNNPSPMYGSPSIQCLNTYLQRISYMPVNSYVVDSMRYPQTYLIQFRVQRCAKLVELDVKDRVAKVLESFQSCL
ncbi:uncharacterized protein LOC109429061 [Aedes albopictus]|uniref:Uncharacterized protein n=1 Tax=Aedes albopictus TaxID=7160 RepID=A0ABM1Z9G2_AEDAL